MSADALPEAPNEHLIPPLEEPDRITPEEAAAACGVWFDEANHGHYLGRDIVWLALNRGWHPVDEHVVQDLADRYEKGDLTDDEWGIWNDIPQEAEDWLNEAVAPPGYSFGCHDGSFFFQQDAWFCEGESGGYCGDLDHQHPVVV